MPRAKRDADGLTAKERAFIEARARGAEPLAAYNAAYDDQGGSKNTRKRKAYDLGNRDYIKALMAKRREVTATLAEEGYKLDLDGLLQEVAAIMTDPEATRAEKLAAIDRAAKLQGLYESKDKAPINVNVSGGLTIDDKRAAAAAWLDGLNG